MNDTFTIEDAARGILQPEPEGQTEAEEVTDVTEAEDDEAEANEDIEEIEAEDGDDTSEDDDEDGETDEADEAEDEDDDDPLLTMPDGSEVKFSELQNGYLREKDYRKKTMALADEKRTFEAEREQVVTHMQQQYAQLQDALATFAIEQEQEPDWGSLSGEEYDKARRSWDKSQKQKLQAQQAYQQLKAQQHQEVVQRETAALLDRFPEWRDPEVLTAEVAKIQSNAQKFGFSQEELASLTDHRQIALLHRLAVLEAKEAEWSGNAAKLAKRLSKAAKKPAPGSKPSKTKDADKARRQKLDRLRKTGSIQDAAAAIIMES